TLMSSWYCRSASLASRKPWFSARPALLTRRSTGRAGSRSRAATASRWSGTVRSAGSTSTAGAPAASRASRSAASRVSSRATVTSEYPSAARCRAKAWPMPDVEPVTRAVGISGGSFLPTRVDGGPEGAVVERADQIVDAGGQRDGPGRGVGPGLVGVPRARDDRADRADPGDPRQCQLRRTRLPARSVDDEPGGGGGELPSRVHPGVVVDAGECLPDIERLAVPVERPVVAVRERGVVAVPAGEQAAGQRHPGDDADAGGRRGRQHLIQWLESERVQDDLHGSDAGPGDRRERLVA